jgi:hypothetical protein
VRFAQEPQDPQTAWVPLPTDLDIPYYFAVCETRTVRADHCIRFAGQLLQLLPGPKDPSLVAQRVTVHTVPEGDLYVYLDKRRIAHQRVAAPPAPAPLPNAAATPPAQPAAPTAQAQRQATGVALWPTLTQQFQMWNWGQRTGMLE